MNQGISLVLHGRALAGHLGKVFEEDLRHSRPIEAQRWRARGPWHRFRELLSLPVRKEL